jgi:CBS domain-containing protein
MALGLDQAERPLGGGLGASTRWIQHYSQRQWLAVICPNCGFDNLPGSEDCGRCQQDLTHLDRPAPHDRIERALMDDPVSLLRPAKPVTVWPTATLRETMRSMIEHNVGALLVVAEGGRLLGIFSERDALLRVVGLRDSYEDLPVSLFMTADPETVGLEDKLAYALHKMDSGGYRHLPVMQADRPVGIISVRDLLRYIIRHCNEGQCGPAPG